MKRGATGHPKMRELARALDRALPHAVGTLALLWHWTAQYAPAGDVGRYTDAAIEAACGWDGEPGRLVEALTAPSSRFLDTSPDHRLIVHDWPDHAEDSVHKALARACQRFANGKEPKLGGLKEDEKARAVAAFRTPSAAAAAPLVAVEPQTVAVSATVEHLAATKTGVAATDGGRFGGQRSPAVAVAVAVAVPTDNNNPAQLSRPPTATDGDQRPPQGPPSYTPVDQAKCPDCGRTAVVRQLEKYTEPGTAPGWVCSKRREGCRTEFPVGTWVILEQLPEQQREAVRRSVERVAGPEAAAKISAPPKPIDPQAASEEAQLRQDHAEELAAEYVQAGGQRAGVGDWLRGRIDSEKLVADLHPRVVLAVDVLLRRKAAASAECDHAAAKRHLARNPTKVVDCPDCGVDVRGAQAPAPPRALEQATA